MQDPANLMRVEGHAGRHAMSYHKLVLRTLANAMKDVSPQQARATLVGALNKIRSIVQKNPDILKGK